MEEIFDIRKEVLDFSEIEEELKSIDIKVTPRFGSNFQRNFALNSLIQALNAWKMYLVQSHKKNAIGIEINFNK